jgi:hypothetical protein
MIAFNVDCLAHHSKLAIPTIVHYDQWKQRLSIQLKHSKCWAVAVYSCPNP